MTTTEERSYIEAALEKDYLVNSKRFGDYERKFYKITATRYFSSYIDVCGWNFSDYIMVMIENDDFAFCSFKNSVLAWTDIIFKRAKSKERKPDVVYILKKNFTSSIERLSFIKNYVQEEKNKFSIFTKNCTGVVKTEKSIYDAPIYEIKTEIRTEAALVDWICLYNEALENAFASDEINMLF